jgi:hypothetical protein
LTSGAASAGNAADPSAAIVTADLARALWDAAPFPPLPLAFLPGGGVLAAQAKGHDGEQPARQPGEQPAAATSDQQLAGESIEVLGIHLGYLRQERESVNGHRQSGSIDSLWIVGRFPILPLT